MGCLDDPARFLEPTAFVDSDAPGVIAFVRENEAKDSGADRS